ncbi:MAG: hypothetical protein ACE5PV_13320, partial [Candidatus Poribacteria bacterium]
MKKYKCESGKSNAKKGMNRREFMKGAAIGLVGTTVALNSFTKPIHSAKAADVAGSPAANTSKVAQFVRVIEGPTVLHTSIAGQWGGHTFSYLLLSEHCVFWSATAYNAEDKTPTALVGQQPRPGSPLAPAVSIIRFDEPNVKGINQPQMLRSPDGYIHVFIGVTHTTDNPNF